MNNYSFSTSLPAYQDNALIKRRQADDLFLFIKRGANNLLQLSQLTGLPQSTVSGRCNDLLSEGKIKYDGHTIFADRKRKKICVIKPVAALQNELF
jgi:predicted transcriptional regulator